MIARVRRQAGYRNRQTPRTSPLSIMANPPRNVRTHVNHLEIWHWNCRTFHKRAAALLQVIQTTPVKPDIICLQETGAKPVMQRGYYTFSSTDFSKIATLVAKDISSNVHYISGCQTSHHVIEIYARKRSKPSTFIVNVYSPPKEKGTDFEALVAGAVSLLRRQDRLIFLGDFNAPHTSWGLRAPSHHTPRCPYAVGKQCQCRHFSRLNIYVKLT